MNTQLGASSDTLTFARILADATRQEIMRLCCCRWCTVGELAESLAVTQPTVSHHLALLREAGLVAWRRQGRQTFYSLNQDRVALCCGQLLQRYAPEASAANPDPMPAAATPSKPAAGDRTKP